LADNRKIGGDYFKALDMAIIAGRTFSDHDDLGAQRVAIVSEGLAKHFFPDGAVGKRIKIGELGANAPWLSIVGVVADVRHTMLNTEPRPQIYLPYTQYSWLTMTLVARGTSDPRSLITGLREAIWAFDKDQPVTNVGSMEDYVSKSLSQRRFIMLLLSIFAAVALFLAIIGLYGVMSYSVGQRTREIGIRVALGARNGDIRRLVVREGMILAI